MGTINVTLRVDTLPEISRIPDPHEYLVEFHYTLADGGTLDLIMPGGVAEKHLAIAAAGLAEAKAQRARGSDVQAD